MQRQVSILFNGIDSETPPKQLLCAKYTRSFAYYTVKDRLPVILTKVIDHLVRDKDEIKKLYGQEAEEDMKKVIGQISKLKNEVQTNKPLNVLESTDEDADIWNKYLSSMEDEETACWFQSPWLYVENYMYRRINEIFENTSTLKSFDPFRAQKMEAYKAAISELKAVAKSNLRTLKNPPTKPSDLQEHCVKFLKMCLWGNKCDLSLSNGEVSEEDSCLSNVSLFDDHLLVDDSLNVFDVLQKTPGGIVDLVHDNAAYELFTDLCLCDFLCTTGLASKIRFHAKRIPWYVSDVTRSDVDWLLEEMRMAGMSELADRWIGHFKEGIWTLQSEIYWTLPFDYNDMKDRDQELFNTLAQSKLVIFKGDLNYRKLLGDINWPHSENFTVAIRNFKPTNVVALRTVKADLICGVDQTKSDTLTAQDQFWMRTGDYGLIQLFKHSLSP